jgi:hypothetical protein
MILNYLIKENLYLIVLSFTDEDLRVQRKWINF